METTGLQSQSGLENASPIQDAQALYAQGLKTYQEGSVPEASKALEEARAGFLAQGDQAQAAKVANDLGVVYYLTGRRDEALKLLQDALAVLEKHGDVFGQAKALGNVAQLMNRAGDKQNAERNYARAAELFHQIGKTDYEFDTFRALSQMQLQSGRWLEALASYDHGLAAKGGSRFLRWFLQIPLRLLHVR